MKKIVLFASLALSTSAFAQKAMKPTLKKGQQLEITSEMHLVPEGMGPTVNSNLVQTMTVQDAGATSNTLEQKVKSILFDMDMMGQKQSFDSKKPADANGDMGKAFAPALQQSNTLTLDANGTVTAVASAGTATTKAAESNDMMANMLQQFTGGMMSTPKVGSASLFKILPEQEIKKGDTWTMPVEGDPKGKTVYTVSDLNAGEIVIDFTSESTTDTKQETMGMETVIHKTDMTKGIIKIDNTTGLLKSKTATINSAGTVDVMGQSIPLNNTITMSTVVKVL